MIRNKSPFYFFFMNTGFSPSPALGGAAYFCSASPAASSSAIVREALPPKPFGASLGKKLLILRKKAWFRISKLLQEEVVPRLFFFFTSFQSLHWQLGKFRVREEFMLHIWVLPQLIERLRDEK